MPALRHARALPTGSSPCDRAEALLRTALLSREAAIRSLLGRCESPVKEILLTALWDRWQAVPLPDLDCLEATHTLQGALWRVVIEPQRSLYTSAGRFRADCLISGMDALPANRPIRWDTVVVEVTAGETAGLPSPASPSRRLPEGPGLARLSPWRASAHGLPLFHFEECCHRGLA